MSMVSPLCFPLLIKDVEIMMIQIISLNKINKSSFLIYDSNTSSMATSHKKATNKNSSSDYDNELYNNEIFKQVSLENPFNVLKEKIQESRSQKYVYCKRS